MHPFHLRLCAAALVLVLAPGCGPVVSSAAMLAEHPAAQLASSALKGSASGSKLVEVVWQTDRYQLVGSFEEVAQAAREAFPKLGAREMSTEETHLKFRVGPRTTLCLRREAGGLSIRSRSLDPPKSALPRLNRLRSAAARLPGVGPRLDDAPAAASGLPRSNDPSPEIRAID